MPLSNPRRFLLACISVSVRCYTTKFKSATVPIRKSSSWRTSTASFMLESGSVKVSQARRMELGVISENFARKTCKLGFTKKHADMLLTIALCEQTDRIFYFLNLHHHKRCWLYLFIYKPLFYYCHMNKFTFWDENIKNYVNFTVQAVNYIKVTWFILSHKTKQTT